MKVFERIFLYYNEVRFLSDLSCLASTDILIKRLER